MLYNQLLIYNSMKKYSISEGLFNEIIHIDENKEKSDYIKPNAAIFIDNSYCERIKIAEKFLKSSRNFFILLLELSSGSSRSCHQEDCQSQNRNKDCRSETSSRNTPLHHKEHT